MEENKEVLLTQEGFDKLEQELENLKTVKRVEIARIAAHNENRFIKLSSHSYRGVLFEPLLEILLKVGKCYMEFLPGRLDFLMKRSILEHGGRKGQ